MTHYEDYVPPKDLRWMHTFLVACMRLSQVGEMRNGSSRTRFQTIAP